MKAWNFDPERAKAGTVDPNPSRSTRIRALLHLYTETQASHGAVMVLWRWCFDVQPFPALATAESELLEAIDGLHPGDAVDSMIQEHEDPYVKTLFVDNLAATGFFSNDHANWRTRHLRLRAQHVRWRITNLDWR